MGVQVGVGGSEVVVGEGDGVKIGVGVSVAGGEGREGGG